MADFKTHITVSTALGVAYGGGAYVFYQPYFENPTATCVLAGTLCSVSGMLPDLDSDSGVPLRESLTFASACIPMLLLDRFQKYGWQTEMIVLAGAVIYGVVRFGLGTLLKKYTVHRGMFHSIPAALIAGEAAFLLCSYGNEYVRAYKACAVMLGFMSHLVLDEIWSVKVSGGRIGLKSSSGTAMKLWSGSLWANISTYAKLALLSVLVFKDPMWANVAPEAHQLAQTLGNNVQIEPKNLPGFSGLVPGGATPTAGGTTGPAPTNANKTPGTGQATAGQVADSRPVAAAAAYAPPPSGTYIPQGTYVPPGMYAPQTVNRAAPSVPPQYGSAGGAPPSYAPPNYGPAQPGYAPAPGYVPPGYAAPGYAPPAQGAPPNYQQPSYPPPNYPQATPGYSIPMGVGPGPGRPRY